MFVDVSFADRGLGSCDYLVGLGLGLFWELSFIEGLKWLWIQALKKSLRSWVHKLISKIIILKMDSDKKSFLRSTWFAKSLTLFSFISFPLFITFALNFVTLSPSYTFLFFTQALFICPCKWTRCVRSTCITLLLCEYWEWQVRLVMMVSTQRLVMMEQPPRQSNAKIGRIGWSI